MRWSAGAASLQDYELLEALLTYSVPRRDTKPAAKNLLKHRRTLAEVLRTEPAALAKLDGIGENSATLLAVVSEIAKRSVRDEIDPSEVIFTNWDKVKSYVRALFKGERKEQLHVLYLDARNRLVADEVASRGTVDRTAIYVREIVERALHFGATSIILAHNHPAGDPDPSEEDLQMTRAVQQALTNLGMDLHDHLIVGKSGRMVGFKDLGLL